MTVIVAPATTVPSAHGKPALHAPLAERTVSPVGVGSLSVTLTASDGPAFLRVIVYVIGAPGVAFAGPVLPIIPATRPLHCD